MAFDAATEEILSLPLKTVLFKDTADLSIFRSRDKFTKRKFTLPLCRES